MWPSFNIVESFILFDKSKLGATRKVVARNHLVLGVDLGVVSVARQEALKQQFPVSERVRHRMVELPLDRQVHERHSKNGKDQIAETLNLLSFVSEGPVTIIERAPRPRSTLGLLAHPGQR